MDENLVGLTIENVIRSKESGTINLVFKGGSSLQLTPIYHPIGGKPTILEVKSIVQKS